MAQAKDRPTALVTGGTGGIGKAICLELARRGSVVAFTYHRNRDGAMRLCDELRALNGDEAPVCGSVELRDEEQVAAFLGRITGEKGPVTQCVYASGPDLPLDPVAKVSAEVWSQIIDVDVKGAFNIFSACLPDMRKHGKGALLAVTTAALMHLPRNDVLSAAPKAAIEVLIRAIAKEEGRAGIRANCVAPGWIHGGMGARLIDTTLPPEFVEKMRKSIPLQRLGDVADVARAAAFLLSDDAAFITGHTIPLDGGAHI